MREILFRGKRIDNGEWVEGDLFHHSDGKTEIFVPKEVLFAGKYLEGIWRVVDPATIGQYTGMTDKNGVKVFEGDIVSAKNKVCLETYRFLVKFDICGGVKNVEHPVGYPCFFFEETTGVIPSEYMMRKDPVYFLNAYGCEVIGNIHDTPELLEKKEDKHEAD